MAAGSYLLGALRLALILGPLVVGSRLVRRALLPTSSPPLGWLIDAVTGTAGLVVASELLGVLTLFRWWTLAALLWLATGLAVLWVRTREVHPVARAWEMTPAVAEAPRTGAHRLQLGAAALAMAVVWGQWALLTADAYGGGIFSFDSLWYHLPFAASFAQTGSVSRVLFTQADPFVAYYPANSELVHSVALLAMGNDLLSPALNLVWLAVALLASWCFGRPWRMELVTLTAGCLIMGIPILGAGQPGSAFNDIFGLAFLMAAVAIIPQAGGRTGPLAVAGLALGLALGTKVTFVAPAAVLVCGAALVSPSGRRLRVLMAMGAACLLAGGWWYLRALLDTGNPLGLRVHLGSIALPGPNSPLANAASQTVLAVLGQRHLWESRLAPGLNYALGPLWPILVLGAVTGLIAALVVRGTPPVLRVLAVSGLVAVLAYLVFPTGASAIEEQSQLFAVNLRYATPAIAIGVLLAVALLVQRRPQDATALTLVMLLVLLITQLEHQLWPRQPARHGAFLVAAVVIAMVWVVGRVRLAPRRRWTRAIAATVLAVAGGFIVQRHYFAQRYLSAVSSANPTSEIYHWAQGISHTRVALYGTVEQYPLYGAFVTNRVDYLGRPAPTGGYRPIATCSAWRAALHRGGFRYVVETPGPTGTVPPAWTADDAAARLILQPAQSYAVYRLDPSVAPTPC